MKAREVSHVALFSVLIFSVEIVPPPAGKLLQFLTAFFLTLGTLTINRFGTATLMTMIAGLIDALYTGIPAALLLLTIRGATFDALLGVLGADGSRPPVQKVVIASAVSSALTGFAAYVVIAWWLMIMPLPLEVYVFFAALATGFSALGAATAWKLHTRLK